ncbi:YkvA family protein [Streptomyces sp. NPDC004065]|uniref:YkvA family protein n=1 Tax=Streptomyces sp. NPDC004065 TaxID=3364689 RepID=UPI00384C8AAD
MDSTTKALLVAAVLAAVVLALAAGVFVRLLRTRRDLRRAGLPTGPRWVFWGAVLYFLLPVDLVPDPVYLDDIGVLLLALRTLHQAAGGRVPLPARRTEHPSHEGHSAPHDYAP